jgi:dienelactone hydrolase
MTTFRLLSFTLVLALASCKGNTTATTTEKTTPTLHIKEEAVTYNADTITLNGFVAYNDSSEAKRPVVLIAPEWWGVTDYPKNRAKQLAELGYLAFAIDFYGNGATADNPDDAGKLAMPFYKDPQLAKQRFDAALAKIKTYPQADTTNIAAIGYCFGGGMVLNMARLGEDLKGVVSFHGSLVGVPPVKVKTKANVLVCHGEADVFVKPEEVAKFKSQMDSAGVAYTFKSYPNATHAFTNPGANEKAAKFKMPIAYNAAADTASFKDMQEFFGLIFK